MQKVCKQLQGVFNANEKKLETAHKLLKLKLITKGMSLRVLIAYYEVCNALLRIALKIL